MTTYVTTYPYRTDLARDFLNTIADEHYFFFYGNHTTPANSAVVDDVEQNVSNTFTEMYRSMIAGKRIDSNSASLVIRNIPYQANVIYTIYDDKAADLEDEDFYVVVNASSYYHVFKCLDNNQGAASTIEPNFADISGANTEVYQTSDGYRWKYMYTFSSAQKLKFSTSDYVPYVENTAVSEAAVPGAIDIVYIENSGRHYNNYLTGTFTTADIRVDGDSTMYQISNTVAKTVNGYYTGCMLYLSAGTGQGQYRRITDYISNANGNFIVLSELFITVPTNGTQYEIYPEVIVSGNGDETTNAVARALINAVASNAVYRVEMLNRGAGYVYATANVVANAVVGVQTEAEVRPILPPRGGHGSDGAVELYVRNLGISVTFANNENGLIPATNFYRQVGIIKNPMFNDVDINLKWVTGTFLNSEIVYKIDVTPIKMDLTTNVNSTNVSSNNADFTHQLDVGQTVMLKTSDNTAYQLLTINSVVNSTMFTTTENVFFTTSNAVLHQVNVIGQAAVSNVVSATKINVTNCEPVFYTDSEVIGASSGAHATVTNTTRGGVTKDFETFVALRKFVGSLTFGNFVQNETAVQGNSSITVHSTSLDTGILTLYGSRQVGDIVVDNTLTGNLSTAIMSVTAKYKPEIAFGSGRPIYIENLSPITRQDDQSEVFKVILDF